MGQTSANILWGLENLTKPTDEDAQKENAEIVTVGQKRNVLPAGELQWRMRTHRKVTQEHPSQEDAK